MKRTSSTTARRRWVIAAVVLVAVSAMAAIAWNAAWSSIDARLEGSYSARVLEAKEALQVWSRMNPYPSSALPPGEKLLVNASWTDEQKVHWPATECEYVVFVAHPQPAHVIAYQGEESSLGSSGVVDEAIQRHPEIPTRDDADAGQFFAGSTFSVSAARSGTKDLSVLLAAETVGADRTRVGILYTCNGRLIRFTWLEESARPAA